MSTHELWRIEKMGGIEDQTPVVVGGTLADTNPPLDHAKAAARDLAAGLLITIARQAPHYGCKEWNHPRLRAALPEAFAALKAAGVNIE